MDIYMVILKSFKYIILFLFTRILGKHKFLWLRLDEDAALTSLRHNLWVSKSCYFLSTYQP